MAWGGMMGVAYWDDAGGDVIVTFLHESCSSETLVRLLF